MKIVKCLLEVIGWSDRLDSELLWVKGWTGEGEWGESRQAWVPPQSFWLHWSLLQNFKSSVENTVASNHYSLSHFLGNEKSGCPFVCLCSVAQLCPTLFDPMNCSTPGFPVHHQLLGLTQTHIHWVSDAIQPSHPLSSPSPPAPNPSQHQSLFQWVNSSHEVAKVLEFQLQHHSFQRTPRTDLL